MISVTRAGGVVPAGSISGSELADDYDRDNGQAGMYAPSWCPTAGNTALIASRAYAVRFVPSRDLTVSSIAFVVGTAAAADDACDVGIYNAALTTKLVSKGATTGLLNSTGVKNVDITDTPLVAGTVYYAAFSVGTFGGSGASVVMALASGTASAASFFGSTAGLVEMSAIASGHPLAATHTATQTAGAPILALRE